MNMILFLQFFTVGIAFLFIGMAIMALMTSGSKQDLYSEIYDLQRENKELKEYRDTLIKNNNRSEYILERATKELSDLSRKSVK